MTVVSEMTIAVPKAVRCKPGPRLLTTFYIKNINISDERCAGRLMDVIDTKILKFLQEDASISIAELAQKVNLSQTPCWKRIQRLEASGVIKGRVALVDPDKIGLSLTAFVAVEAYDHSEAWMQRFADFVSDLPEVMEFYRMAGDVDYILRVVVPDMAAYDRFYRNLIGALPLKNVTSRFAMERIKSTTAFVLRP
jgi:Lrp/AsnC family transcriptional regulator